VIELCLRPPCIASNAACATSSIEPGSDESRQRVGAEGTKGNDHSRAEASMAPAGTILPSFQVGRSLGAGNRLRYDGLSRTNEVDLDATKAAPDIEMVRCELCAVVDSNRSHCATLRDLAVEPLGDRARAKRPSHVQRQTVPRRAAEAEVDSPARSRKRIGSGLRSRAGVWYR
jgi:hypothetical protein